ncbi:DNA primase [Hallella bergensis DSM 17361]|uniref:DNA primase n=1 Tax=Hallella bergensis DSM 17361 TaxID=585502 RepID=D1PX59_9BACT|nr:DNA primase [Hallella bergensis]EFA44019.1 DNA primase [Hallella bergensis DSM 17361]
MIDRQTVEKIKDTANIVEVVSEFVTLRKSGANYKGLCPFHNEKTPSFYVSPARGICHCFGCGKGGTPVNFVMEHEQMTYPEALRWLAQKYHIEIKERELTDEEKAEQSQRESMFIVNDWACNYFEDLLHNHADGKAIGMQYFHSRGFRDDVIRKFRLGYDLSDRSALARAALNQGYKEEFLLSTGICFKTDRGELLDRYAGRVVFPWIGISGKVVGFTARVLDSRTKGVNQKYVNSPASDIYHKDRELYGIWQAKKSIAKEDRVFMVEGQADVIAMHQCGIENVVANSGTALSFHQIHTLHRFTSNITLIYDNDPAGIHAAIKGTDMLLAEGMNLKVLLLPDGKDPDEFARSHTAAEFREYIEQHQSDFIQFKTDLLLKGETDPTKRADAINSIVESISMVQDQILRNTYIHDCAQRIDINERTLINQMNAFIRRRRKSNSSATPTMREQGADSAAGQTAPPIHTVTPMQQAGKVERMLAQMVVRYGERFIRNIKDEDGNVYDLTIAQYIRCNLESDQLEFKHQVFNKILEEAVQMSDNPEFRAEPYFIHHDDIQISQEATQMAADHYHFSLSKEEEILNEEDRRENEENEMERLKQQVDHLLLDFRMDYVELHLKELMNQIKQASDDMEQLKKLMEEYREMQEIRNKLAKMLGSNIII